MVDGRWYILWWIEATLATAAAFWRVYHIYRALYSLIYCFRPSVPPRPFRPCCVQYVIVIVIVRGTSGTMMCFSVRRFILAPFRLLSSLLSFYRAYVLYLLYTIHPKYYPAYHQLDEESVVWWNGDNDCDYHGGPV